MCGIFGLLTSDKSIYKQEFLSTSFIQLASLSETRGKDSSGICTLDQNINTINIYLYFTIFVDIIIIILIYKYAIIRYYFNYDLFR